MIIKLEETKGDSTGAPELRNWKSSIGRPRGEVSICRWRSLSERVCEAREAFLSLGTVQVENPSQEVDGDGRVQTCKTESANSEMCHYV